LWSAKISSCELSLLQHGAHRAIEHKDALAEQLAQAKATLDKVIHAYKIVPWRAGET
jgi:hypothetical protein